MTARAYFWTKACPGVFYVWDAPRGTTPRRSVGKVWRALDGAYRATFNADGLEISRRDRTTPMNQIANVQFMVRKAISGAQFTREGF